MAPAPHVPKMISEEARACLEAIEAAGFGHLISLGGAFALSYYHEYRPTFDVDAWWTDAATEKDRKALVAAVRSAMQSFGKTDIRVWGDVASVEVVGNDRRRFSFQVARRSALIREPLQAPWPKSLFLDSLEDLVAAKMEALNARGLPRDFRDIYSLHGAGLLSVEEAWSLWKKRRQAAGQAADARAAALGIMTHLQRIEKIRPLEGIKDIADRGEADALRRWFKETFLHGLV